jgi:hypothetical protein
MNARFVAAISVSWRSVIAYVVQPSSRRRRTDSSTKVCGEALIILEGDIYFQINWSADRRKLFSARRLISAT